MKKLDHVSLQEQNELLEIFILIEENTFRSRWKALERYVKLRNLDPKYHKKNANAMVDEYRRHFDPNYKAPVTVEALREYMREHNPHIYFEKSDLEIKIFIKRYEGLSIEKVADYFSDSLLANGAYAQE